jgi:hypothetical protein
MRKPFDHDRRQAMIWIKERRGYHGLGPVRSGDLPAAVAEGGDNVEASAEGTDMGADDVDPGEVAVFDLGDACLGDAQCLGELGLGQTGGLADLGELAPRT